MKLFIIWSAFLKDQKELCSVAIGNFAQSFMGKKQTPDWKLVFNPLFCKRKSFHKLPDCTDHPRKVPGGKFSEVETDVGLCDNKSLSYFYINIASRIQVSAVKNHPLDNFWFYLLLAIGFREPFLLQKGSRALPMSAWQEGFRTLRSASKGFALLKPTIF